MKKLLILFAVIVLLPAGVWAAGTVSMGQVYYGGGIKRVAISWTSDASGDATYTTTQLGGVILRVTFDPDGTAAPTDNYDITLKDENGIDVLAGSGANLSTSTTSSVCPQINDQSAAAATAAAISGTLALAVSNAGNAKSGQVILYLK